MTGSIHSRIGKPIKPAHHSIRIPPRWVEYTYYFTIFYSLLSGYLGIEVPLIAAGTIVALAGFCYRRMGSRVKEVLAPITLLLACLTSFILIQIAFHGVSPTNADLREFILWFCGMIILQSLFLRPGFLQRCTIVLFVLGLIVVPYLGITSAPSEVERAAIEVPVAGNLTNANGLAGWFGFCLISLAIAGLETKSNIVRIIYWMAAAGSLLIVGLTVSRGALFGIGIALTVAFRRFLKRAFIPVFLLIIFGGLMFMFGLFDNLILHYAERATEETGREVIWPAVIERFFTSPLVGVGVSQRLTGVEGYPSAAHNSFLFFALTSGVVPLALWVAFWIRAAERSLSRAARQKSSPFQIPFLLYAFVTFMLGDITTVPWILLTLSVGAGSSISDRRHRVLLPQRIRGHRTAPSLGSSFTASNLK